MNFKSLLSITLAIATIISCKKEKIQEQDCNKCHWTLEQIITGKEASVSIQSLIDLGLIYKDDCKKFKVGDEMGDYLINKLECN